MDTFTSTEKGSRNGQKNQPRETHECSFGYLDKDTTSKLLSIEEKLHFMKCNCGIVRPLDIKLFNKVCTTGKLMHISKILQKKRLYLHIPQR